MEYPRFMEIKYKFTLYRVSRQTISSVNANSPSMPTVVHVLVRESHASGLDGDTIGGIPCSTPQFSPLNPSSHSHFPTISNRHN